MSRAFAESSRFRNEKEVAVHNGAATSWILARAFDQRTPLHRIELIINEKRLKHFQIALDRVWVNFQEFCEHHDHPRL